MLLEREFGGAANLRSLENTSKMLAFSGGRYTSSMLGDGSRVIIDGNIVLLADLEY